MAREELVAEFEHTRGRHGGRVSLAAPILGVTPFALARALFRAKRDGVHVRFYDDTKALRRQRSAA
jgi:hypothetical protein